MSGIIKALKSNQKGILRMKMQPISNKGDDTVSELLKKMINHDSKIDVATSAFSIYAFHELQHEIKRSKELRVLLTKNFFESTETGFLRRYKISQNNMDISGNKYEIKLRNRMNSAFIARETAELVEEKSAFKLVSESINWKERFIVSNTKDSDKNVFIPEGVKFTADGLGLTESNDPSSVLALTGSTEQEQFVNEFNHIWNDKTQSKDVSDKVMDKVKDIFKENSPEWVYYVSLYHIFHEQLTELDQDTVIKEGTGFRDTKIWNLLYQFQKDGVVGLIEKLEKYHGAILADSVGLGKTFSALAVMKYYQLRNYSILVLTPKRLRDNWIIYQQNDKRNILAEDKLNFDVLNHTDLSRYKGKSGDIDLATINWGNYDLVVIDESHNFRNNIKTGKDTPTRYERLMNDIIKSGVDTKVLMLSATPVNNKMSDIKNQIAFMTQGNSKALSRYGINDIDTTLMSAQRTFNNWSNENPKTRKTQEFLDAVDPGYFKILDMVTIARSRKHIEKYYDTTAIGKFPTRMKPINIKSDIDTENKFLPLEEVNKKIKMLSLAMYTPMGYVLPSMISRYEKLYDTKGINNTTLKQTDREMALTGLIRVNLLKRLESSIHSFKLTVGRMVEQLESTINTIDKHQNGEIPSISLKAFDDDEAFDLDIEEQSIGKRVKILLGDMDLPAWKYELTEDLKYLRDIYNSAKNVPVEHDMKLLKLRELLNAKFNYPLNKNNKKIVIFTAFSDTAEYLYNNLSELITEQYGLHTALITGSGKNKTTMENVRTSDMNDILMNFSPISKHREQVVPNATEQIDVLIATDAISEGQNLQDADYLVNYDIHWNPVRVIQRFGRIDRIGSTNDIVQLVNFWPSIDLDAYIDLESRVKGKMVILNTSATGEDDLLNTDNKEMNDLSYRRNQLKQLQEEVMDLEDVNGAISITDLTYNDFKADLANALKKNEQALVNAPKGMYAITKSSLLKGAEPGVIMTLKQNKIDLGKENSILPYLMIYMTMDGEAKIHYTQSKQILDYFKKLAMGQEKVFSDLVTNFNKETQDGRDMSQYSELLSQAIDLIKGKKESVGLDSLFTPGGTTLQTDLLSSMDEVELISFLIIRED